MKSKIIFLSILITVAVLNFCAAQIKTTTPVVTDDAPRNAASTPPPPPQVLNNAGANGVIDFVNVEQQPEFPGGAQAFYKFIADTTHYPATAKQNHIQGRVYIQFTIDVDGSIKDAKVVKGVDGDLDAEALRVVKSMPKWKPGMQNGKPVAVRHTLPIKFMLQ